MLIIFRIVYILPWLFTIAVIAVIWRLLLDPSGVVNYMLRTLGVVQEGVNWFGDPGKALWAVTFVNIWSGYPFFMISLLAALQGISADLYEAAAVDGTNWFQRFLHVTLPQLRPVIISMASPRAMRPYSMVLESSTGTNEVRNPAFLNWKTTAMTIATTAMLDSGNRSSAPKTPATAPAAGLGPGGASAAIFCSLVTTLHRPLRVP